MQPIELTATVKRQAQAERIVRALAAMRPDAFQCYGDCGCIFCGEFMYSPDTVEQHEPDCLYRLSVEWVAAHPAAATDAELLTGLRELLAELDEEFGPIPQTVRDEVERRWRMP